MAQSVKRLTHDFGSGHDLTVLEFEPHIGLCADSIEPALDSLSPSLSLPLPCSCTHSLCLKNKHFLKIKKKEPESTVQMQSNGVEVITEL